MISALPASIGSFLGGIASTVVGAPVKLAANAGLSVMSSWIVDGAEDALREVVKVISAVTEPSLTVSWFSGTYWRVTALAMILTVPFLFAAAVQAVIQSNPAALVRAAFFDLPVAVLATALAAPVITLLLAATDEMCSFVAGGGTPGGSFLTIAGTDLSRSGSGFMVVIIAIVILLASLTLLVEMVMRSAAIYIVVLFLPLGFAAMVWPARRVWIKRMLETLISLILSKFAIVAILAMAVAALGSLSLNPSSLTTALTAMALTVLAAMSPWALLRLLPFAELAANHTGELRSAHSEGLGKAVNRTATGAQLAAGLALDPATEAFSALRQMVNSPDGGGPGSGGRSRLDRGGGGPLPPAPNGWPDGPGEGPSGGDPGGAPIVIPGGPGGPTSVPPTDGPGVTLPDPGPIISWSNYIICRLK